MKVLFREISFSFSYIYIFFFRFSYSHEQIVGDKYSSVVYLRSLWHTVTHAHCHTHNIHTHMLYVCASLDFLPGKRCFIMWKCSAKKSSIHSEGGARDYLYLLPIRKLLTVFFFYSRLICNYSTYKAALIWFNFLLWPLFFARFFPRFFLLCLFSVHIANSEQQQRRQRQRRRRASKPRKFQTDEYVTCTARGSHFPAVYANSDSSQARLLLARFLFAAGRSSARA